jgi:hypothetical protein
MMRCDFLGELKHRKDINGTTKICSDFTHNALYLK